MYFQLVPKSSGHAWMKHACAAVVKFVTVKILNFSLKCAKSTMRPSFTHVKIWVAFTILCLHNGHAFLSLCRPRFTHNQPIKSILWVKNTNKNRRSNKRQGRNDILHVEKGLVERGFHPIIGSDESGRGSIAGPVVAASCCILTDIDSYQPIQGVADSKCLSVEERERIYCEIIDHPEIYAWGIAERSNNDIDESNILISTMSCFQESIEKVASGLSHEANAYGIVDGKKAPKLSIKVPCRPWVKADAEVYSVSLASILAKVSLDRLTEEWHNEFPEYGFNVHKGYATQDHIEAIHRYGPCRLHRLSFKSLKGR